MPSLGRPRNTGQSASTISTCIRACAFSPTTSPTLTRTLLSKNSRRCRPVEPIRPQRCSFRCGRDQMDELVRRQSPRSSIVLLPAELSDFHNDPLTPFSPGVQAGEMRPRPIRRCPALPAREAPSAVRADATAKVLHGALNFGPGSLLPCIGAVPSSRSDTDFGRAAFRASESIAVHRSDDVSLLEEYARSRGPIAWRSQRDEIQAAARHQDTMASAMALVQATRSLIETRSFG